MVVGIDLGTTNSVIAYFDGERAQIIPNRLGKHLTPSVVSIDENDTIYIGETAKAYRNLHPERSISVFKRYMGSHKEYIIGDKTYRPEELSALLLRTLKEDAEAYLKEPITEAVISVPAYFNHAMRAKTKQAGEMAGFKVERIISEPTAAAIAYGIYDEALENRYLVVDLGGGTFDVSLIERFEKILEVQAVAGDNYLGGEDFTQVIVDAFLKANAIEVNDLSLKEQVELRNCAEQCKYQIGEQGQGVMVWTWHNQDYKHIIDETTYEMLCADLLGRIRESIKRVLKDAKLRVSDINKVVLVGGATKGSLIPKFISRLFKQFPDAKVNPDEVVAVGAAIQGAMKARSEAVKEVILTDVCPFTLGTEVAKEGRQARGERGYFSPIIERNTVIPTSRTEDFYTVQDNQTLIRIRILQGENHLAENNVELGQIEIDVPPNRRGMEAVEVTYTYDINALLEVEVKVVSTGKKERKIIKGQQLDMTDEEIQERLEVLSYLKVPPREQEANKLILFRAERLYEQSIGDTRRILGIELTKFDSVLNTQDKRKIEEARKRLTEVVGQLEEW